MLPPEGFTREGLDVGRWTAYLGQEDHFSLIWSDGKGAWSPLRRTMSNAVLTPSGTGGGPLAKARIKAEEIKAAAG